MTDVANLLFLLADTVPIWRPIVILLLIAFVLLCVRAFIEGSQP